ncbi:MAG: hypothetical protein M1826_000978 [Phylliscum demangeonii]|nr:MAG: hypothetical protein M1826_000978 [Phylliscum demangeonii]
MDAPSKISLITQNLQEVLKPEILEDVIRKHHRPLKIYWGTATTGRPHCGYFVPVVKIAHFLRAGCAVKILLADIHGFLDNLKAPLELVNFRAEYYRLVITALLKAVNVPIDQLEFVLGSSYQLSQKYTMDLFRLSSVVTEHDAKKAGSEVVKQVASPFLSGLIYPLMQSLDEEYLDVDAQFGGVDQRKIFALAAESLPKIGYKERAHLMSPMVPGLAGGKMSASEPDSKIDLLEMPDAVRKKIKKAYAVPGVVEGNGMISFVEYVLLPVSALKHGEGRFTVDRREEEGGRVVYTEVESVQEDYRTDKLTPQALKAAVTSALLEMLAPIQAEFQSSPAWQEIEKKAYPPAVPEEKKKKKVKDRGSKFPGASKASADVEAKPDGSIEGTKKAELSLGMAVGAEEALAKLSVDGSAS